MSTVQPTDNILVQRGTNLYHAPADMSTVQPTDLLLINRGGIDYHCTFADWQGSLNKTPNIGTVVLADDAPGGNRFTSQTFTTTVTMTEDGKPASTKGIKAWVEGTLAAKVTAGNYASSATSSYKPSQFLRHYAGDTETGFKPGNPASLGFAGNPASAGRGAGFAWGEAAGGGAAAYNVRWQPPVPLVIAPGEKIIYSAWTVGEAEAGGPAAFLNCLRLYDGATDVTTQFTRSHSIARLDGSVYDVDQVVGLNATSAPITVTNFRFYRFGSGGGNDPVVLTGLYVNGEWLTDTAAYNEITLTNPNLSGLSIGRLVTGATSGATGHVAMLNPPDKLTLRAVTGTFQIGEAIIYSSTISNAKLYTKLNASLTVTDLQSADPGYTAFTGLAPRLTFPATLPSGNAPDLDLPAGSTLQTEVKATNTAGSDTAQSAKLTPA